MKERRYTISGFLSAVQGVLYLLAVFSLAHTTFLHSLADPESIAAGGVYPLLFCLSILLLGLFGFVAVAPSTGTLLGEDTREYLEIGRRLGMLCLAVITGYYAWLFAGISGGRTMRAALLLPAWIGWFMFGGMGLWVAAVGAAAFESGKLPKFFVLFCIVKTVGFWVALTGILAGQAWLAAAGAVAGCVIGGPLYHGCLGQQMMCRKGRG